MRNVHKDIIENLFHHSLGPMMGWNTKEREYGKSFYYIDKTSFGYTILAEIFDSPMMGITTISISGTPKSARELIAWMDGIIWFIQHPQLKEPFNTSVVGKLTARRSQTV